MRLLRLGRDLALVVAFKLQARWSWWIADLFDRQLLLTQAKAS